MKQLTKVGLDVDGIFANWYLGMCRKYGEPYEKLPSWGEIEWMENKHKEVYDDEHFWRTLPIIEPPESINFDVTAYITAIPPHLAKARQYWLDINGYPKATLVCSSDKVTACKALGIDLMLDDSPNNVRSLLNAGIDCVLYVPPFLDPHPDFDHTINFLPDLKKYIIWDKLTS